MGRVVGLPTIDPTMRNRLFHQSMDPPALCAALLLLLMWGMGRVLAKPTQATRAAAHRCSPEPQQPLDHGEPAVAPQQYQGDAALDCGHCPPLAQLLPCVAMEVARSASSNVGTPAPSSGSFQRTWRHPSGLGSRGPPLML